MTLQYSNISQMFVVQHAKYPTHNISVGKQAWSYLKGFENLLVWKLHFVPHHLHPLFSVHGQVRTLNAWDISLTDLNQKKTDTEREERVESEFSTPDSAKFTQSTI